MHLCFGLVPIYDCYRDGQLDTGFCNIHSYYAEEEIKNHLMYLYEISLFSLMKCKLRT
jgi:hypothetical protein